jgi:hypothetical protein
MSQNLLLQCEVVQCGSLVRWISLEWLSEFEVRRMVLQVILTFCGDECGFQLCQAVAASVHHMR